MARLTGLWLMFCSLFFGIGSVAAQPSGPAQARSCPSVITACGCVITSAGTYTVGNDLNADQSSKPNCIEIAAPYSILNLKGFSVIGNGYYGTSIGILIRKGADHVVVEGGDEGTSTPANDAGMNGQYFPGTQSVVTQWNIAIEDDGDDAAIELFKDLGGNIFQQHDGNATAGIFFNGVKRSLAANFLASYNGQAGVIVKNSSGIHVSNLSTIGNHESGIWLDSSDDSTIATATAAGNGKYGIWLYDSSQNRIVDCNGTSGNGDTGILLGCGNQKCTGNIRSNNNRITNSGGPGNQMAGIVIEKHSNDNIVTITHNDGNPENHDMVDLNPHCGTNIWYNNTGLGNQNCIH